MVHYLFEILGILFVFYIIYRVIKLLIKGKPPTVYVDDYFDVDEALLLMTDKWIDDGYYSCETVMTLRNALKYYRD